MKTVPVPGGSAVFREPHELSPRQKNLIKAAAISAQSAMIKIDAVMEPEVKGETAEQRTAREARNEAAAAKVNLTLDESMAMMQMREATIIASLASWTLDRALPTMADLGDLPNDIYDALDTEIGGLATNATRQISFDPTPDKSAPFGPSSDSAGNSREAMPASPLTPTSSSDGSPTSGESSSPESPQSSTSTSPVT